MAQSFWKLFDSFFWSATYTYHMTQQYHSCVFTQEKVKTYAHTMDKTCIQIFVVALYIITQTGSNSKVHQQVNVQKSGILLSYEKVWTRDA